MTNTQAQIIAELLQKPEWITRVRGGGLMQVIATRTGCEWYESETVHVTIGVRGAVTVTRARISEGDPEEVQQALAEAFVRDVLGGRGEVSLKG